MDYSNGGLALKRDTASTLPEIQNPTGWFYLTVVNSGGAASNFSVSVTQAGTPISLPSSCVVPTTLAASGQPGDTFTCTFPRTFNATQSYALAATASATNAVTVSGQQQTVTVTTSAVSTCSAGQKVVPNLVDTLDPSADGTNKTIGQAKAAWAAAGFTGAFNSIPAGVTNSHHVAHPGQDRVHLPEHDERRDCERRLMRRSFHRAGSVRGPAAVLWARHWSSSHSCCRSSC